MSDFKLDTSGMSETAKQGEALAKRMQDLRSELESSKNDLLSSWVGEGRNEFEKQFRLLNQQFSDIIDSTWDMYEKIIDAETTYIQHDTDLAKKEDGKDRKF